MCSRNTSSRSPKKSPRPCATSKAGSRRIRRPLRLVLMLAPLLLLSTAPATPQEVQRSELPPLPGAAPPDLGEGRPAPPAAPGFPAPPAFAPPASGSTAATSPLPYDLWRGVDAPSLERLLAAVPLPSPSPAFATLIARALAAGDPLDGRGSRAARFSLGTCRSGRGGGGASRPRRGNQRAAPSRPLCVGAARVRTRGRRLRNSPGRSTCRQARAGGAPRRGLLCRGEGRFAGGEASPSACSRRGCRGGSGGGGDWVFEQDSHAAAASPQKRGRHRLSFSQSRRQAPDGGPCPQG